MKRGLRGQESVKQFLAFVNGSVDDVLAGCHEFAEVNVSRNASLFEAMGRTKSEVARVHERAKALANLLADVSAEKCQHPPPWHSKVKTGSAGRLNEMRWYCERMVQALDLGEQLAEDDDLLQLYSENSTAPNPMMREAVELLIVNTFYSHVLVMKCAWPECGNLTIEDRNVRDPRHHRRYCATACRRAADNDKRKAGGYWKDGKRCVRERNDAM